VDLKNFGGQLGDALVKQVFYLQWSREPLSSPWGNISPFQIRPLQSIVLSCEQVPGTPQPKVLASLPNDTTTQPKCALITYKQTI
jgi:hypothetical protein